MSIKTRVKSLLLFKLRKQLLIYFYLKTALKDLSTIQYNQMSVDKFIIIFFN